jgi:hypothetical protein
MSWIRPSCFCNNNLFTVHSPRPCIHPQPGGTGPCMMSPSDRVTRFTPRHGVPFFVAISDLWFYSEGILTHFQMRSEHLKWYNIQKEMWHTDYYCLLKFTLCSLMDMCHYFREICCIHLQGRRSSHARKGGYIQGHKERKQDCSWKSSTVTPKGESYTYKSFAPGIWSCPF